MEDFVRDFGAEMKVLSENFRSKKIVNLINVLSDTNESLITNRKLHTHNIKMKMKKLLRLLKK